MTLQAASTHRLDRIAMGLSGLCLVHCVGTAVLVGILASASGFLGKPIIHEVGLVLAMILGAAGALSSTVSCCRSPLDRWDLA